METHSQRAIMAKAVRRYLASGESNPDSRDWPGANYIERESRHHTALREALVAAVRRRSVGAQAPTLPSASIRSPSPGPEWPQ
jgi:hypothetical protein